MIWRVDVFAHPGFRHSKVNAIRNPLPSPPNKNQVVVKIEESGYSKCIVDQTAS